MLTNFWNVVSALAGVVAVAVAVVIFMQESSGREKALSAEVISRSKLVNEGVSRAGGQVEIFYEGRRIANFELVQIRILNPGGQPIRSTDFEEPLTLLFSNVTEVLSAEQVDSSPPSLRAQARIDGESVELSRQLLNPTDYVLLEIGVIPAVGEEAKVSVRGRVAGVKSILMKAGRETTGTDQARGGAFQTLVLLQSALMLLFVVLTYWVRFRYRRRGGDTDTIFERRLE